MSLRSQTGGTPAKLYIIDFKRDKAGIPGKVVNIEYEPDRSVYIALIHYTDGEERYILAPSGLKVGNVIRAGDGAELKPGNALPLRSVPAGTLIHNIELQPGKGGQLARTAGAVAQLVGKEDEYAVVRLPSGKLRRIPINCMATIGQVRSARDQKVKLDKRGAEPTPQAAPEPEAVIITKTPTITLVDDASLTPAAKEITVSPGQEINFPVTTKNTGTSIWTEADKYGLGWLFSYELFRNMPDSLRFKLDRGEIIPPGAAKTWNITGLAAPEEPGTYTTVWQMVREDKRFGNKGIVNVITKPVTVKYPAVTPTVAVSPPSGSPGTTFIISITGSTPEQEVVFHGEEYSPASGWQLWHKSVKTDNQGKASLAFKWRYRGNYSVWAVDEATRAETKSVRVAVH